MTEGRKILVVDDDKSAQAILIANLQSDYHVIGAYDGEIGLKLAREWLPDTIFLDIEMPLKNGYEVCAALKADPILHDIPVIFISATSSLNEKVAAFKLGADDYLVKPCEGELLKAKASRSTKLYREKKALDEKAAGAQGLAFEAMNSSADLGRAVRFAERTYAMDSFDKLAEGLFQTMAEFGLETSVMFVSDTGPKFYAGNQYELSPLEKDMFLAIHQEGRFCDFGSRTFCNFKRVSLLIKNMPESNPERYGRIKDAVPWVLGAADSKVGALSMHLALVDQHQYVSDAIDKLGVHTDEALQALTRDENELVNKYLVSSQLLLQDLRKEHARVQAILNANAANSPLAELADEIFSSDVDFF